MDKQMAKARILVVEDDETTANNINRCLEELGYVVSDIVSTGKLAFQKAKEQNPDLILMDIVLKEKVDGIEAAEKIRNNLNIPVIYLTAYADDITLQRAKITEPFGYILKPFKRSDLRVNIELSLYKQKRDKDLNTHLMQLERVADLGQQALSGIDIFTLMHESILLVAKTLEVEYCKVLEILPEGELLLRSGVGWKEGLVGRARVDSGLDSQAGYTLVSKAPVIVNNLKTETRFSGPKLLHEHNVISGISVIIQGQKGAWGVFGVHTTKIRKFTNNDINFILSVANILSATINRKQSEERIEHLASFPKMNIMPILELDFSGAVSFYNDSTIKTLKKLNLKEDATLFLPKDIDDIIKALENKEKVQLYRELEIKDHIFAEDIHLLPKFNVIRLYARDITEQKKRERERLKGQKLESLGVLAGGIAHDFNNILTAIIGNINLAMMQTKEGDKINVRLHKLEKSSLRAKNLTHKLLTFAKGGKPVKKTICIAELLRESVEFAIRGSNIITKFYIDDDLNPVDADECQINQVLNNLLINSQQAMPSGGVLEITARNINDNESREINDLKPCKHVMISIADSGVGIPKNTLLKIFDPYFTTKQNGTGLGLASSFAIIKNHNGSIAVKSENGGGSTFSVYLPASNNIFSKDNKCE